MITRLNGRAYNPKAQGLVERVNRTLKVATANMIVDLKLLSVSLPVLGDLVSQVTHNYNLKIHSSTNYSPYELYYGMKVMENQLGTTTTFVNGIPGIKLNEMEKNEMNTKALAAQQDRAKRNHTLRWRKYKAAIKEKFLVEGQLVLVKPIIRPSPLDKSTTLFHACARVHKILPGTDYCTLEWITDGPTASDKPGTISKNWLVTALTKVEDGTDENEIVENMKNYGGWSRNFEISNILGKLSDTKTGAIYYFIQWEGYSAEDSSWVKRENVMDITTIERYILEFNIPFETLLFDSNEHMAFTERLCPSTTIKQQTKKKKKTNTIFSKVIRNNTDTSTNFSSFNNLQNHSEVGSSNMLIRSNGDCTAKVTLKKQIPSSSNTNNNSSWLTAAYEALSDVGYWQIEPFVYNTKMVVWNNFIAEQRGYLAVQNFLEKYLKSLNWNKFDEHKYFLLSTHPNNYLAAQNLEYFRMFFFTRNTTHNLFIFPTYSLLKTVREEVIIRDYTTKIGNHRQPQMFGIQYHNGAHFYLILYKPSVKKFIIADSLKSLDKGVYIHAVLYLNYLISLVDSSVDLPFNSNDHKADVTKIITINNQTFSFTANLSVDKKVQICSHISIWKQFWTQPNNTDCGI